MYAIYQKLRDERNLKDADVSKMTGINRSAFTDWKQGRSTPKRARLELIAAALNVDVSVFYGESESAPPAGLLRVEAMELMHEAEKANTDDLRAATDYLKRLNAYAELVKERGKNAES